MPSVIRIILFLTTLVIALVSYQWMSSSTTSETVRPADGPEITSLATPTSSTVSLPVSSWCTNPPRDNCSFYDTCLESQYHCGPTGYPLSYGQRYCRKFSEQRDLLSSKGQIWMLDTMHCLQLALVPDVASATAETCDQLSEKAFDTHAPCYLNSGLCTLSPKDWAGIVKIVHLKTLFQSWDAFKASVEAAKECAEFYVWLVEEKIF